MREIVLDTETTGFKPEEGHRIVEIGCIEVENFIPTGQRFQHYINPERDMPEGAFRVHGLSAEFLSGHKLFGEVVRDFLDFIGDSRLVIHNARFDMSFLNHELKILGRPPLSMERTLDTMQLARKRFPTGSISLDALCKRFSIDNSNRNLHGALLDAELLAEVYLELRGGRQPGLIGLGGNPAESDSSGKTAFGQSALPAVRDRPVRPPRPHAPGKEEQKAHAAMLERISNPIWYSGVTNS